MKYCYQCGRMTAGEPLFCNSCGRSYDVKLCPRHHPNPRSAEVCSLCGSRELSTPQPKVSVWWKLAALLLRGIAGLLLIYVALVTVIALVQQPQVQSGLIGLAIIFAIFCWVWSELPDWLRKLVRRATRRKERHGE
jgi:hypothetical protein